MIFQELFLQFQELENVRVLPSPGSLHFIGVFRWVSSLLYNVGLIGQGGPAFGSQGEHDACMTPGWANLEVILMISPQLLPCSELAVRLFSKLRTEAAEVQGFLIFWLHSSKSFFS